MRFVITGLALILVFLLLFGGGIYYGWLAQTKMPSDKLYTDMSSVLGVASYISVVAGCVLIVVGVVRRKK